MPRLADKNPADNTVTSGNFCAENVKTEACLSCQAGMLEFFSQPLSVKKLQLYWLVYLGLEGTLGNWSL